MIGGLLLIVVSCLLAVVRPYKKDVYNTVDIVLLLSFTACGFSLFGHSGYDQRYDTFAWVCMSIALFVPIVYTIVLTLNHITSNRLLALLKGKIEVYTSVRADMQRNDYAEEPLLQNYDSHVNYSREVTY